MRVGLPKHLRRLRAWRKIPARIAAALRPVSRRLARRRTPRHLFPFVPPWDDASTGPTNLSGWNRPIEGEADRLRLGSDGHLYRGGEQIRLFGFNVSRGAALPEQRVGTRVAARLARLGVNYVRIAQHSDLAPAGWLDPVTRASLDPRALDRLDGFVAQLGRHGIYVHLVLNHFRQTYPANIPGFEDSRWLPNGWPTLGTGITQFFTPLIVQNRGVARQLLTHRNRWTGLTYAEDPRIAVVEVTNEDGLVRSWREGALDPIIAAAVPHLRPPRDELQARWNQWLQTRYGDDAALRPAWARGASSGGAQLLANGSFQQGERGWRFDLPGHARACARLADANSPARLVSLLEVQVDRAGVGGGQVGVAQDHLRLEAERSYRMSLWARAADPGGRLSITLRQARPPHRIIAARSVEWTLTTQWKRYVGRLTTATTETDAQLNIAVGGECGTIWIGDASLREDPSSGLLAGESAAGGTVPPLSLAGHRFRTPQVQRDWIAFLFDTESRFFADHSRFLRNELQVRSLLVGTQGDCSPSGAQAGSDVTSMHGYWAHPVFPGRDWDPENWFVQNRSMLDARDEWHALNRIAFYRWGNKPLVVDEYNHPQPNAFGAEGFPLAAAYGAFQDWDGIAGWAYREGGGTRWLSQKDWARPLIRDYFALDTDPVRLASAWLAAVIFRRGDVAPGVHVVPVAVSAEQEREIARTVGLPRGHEVSGSGAQALPLRHRVILRAGEGGEFPNQPPSGQNPVVSDTEELAWEADTAGGAVTINTPRTKAVIGIGRGREFTLGVVSIQPGPTTLGGFGVWAVTALDGPAPIESARRLIIMALGYSQNTGQGWRLYPHTRLQIGPPGAGAAVTLGSAWGWPPALSEGVPARIILPAGRNRVRVWALDARGQRRREIPVRIEGGLAIVGIDARYRTLWYEAAVSSGAV